VRVAGQHRQHVEREVDHDQRVDQLADDGASLGAEPDHPAAGATTQPTEHAHVDQLAEREGGQARQSDRPGGGEGQLVGRVRRGRVDAGREAHGGRRGGAQRDGLQHQVDRDREPREGAHDAPAEVLVDHVGEDEGQREGEDARRGDEGPARQSDVRGSQPEEGELPQLRAEQVGGHEEADEQREAGEQQGLALRSGPGGLHADCTLSSRSAPRHGARSAACACVQIS
jgi:hypothetical protein